MGASPEAIRGIESADPNPGFTEGRHGLAGLNALELEADQSSGRSFWQQGAATRQRLQAMPEQLTALTACRPFVEGELICVFGCGGDRDRTKRPQMAAIAARLADQVLVTSDNPRTEDPEQILRDVVAGIPEGTPLRVDVDRAQAIAEAIAKAQPQDLVLIAGKGHEDYQILGTTKVHFDDREEAEKALRALQYKL